MRDTNEWIAAVNPTDAWKEGWGFLARGWTILLAAIGETGLSAAFIFLFKHQAIGYALLFLAGVTAVGLISLRTILIRVASSGVRLHEICHWLRDESASILEAALSADPQERAVAYTERYNQFHSRAANRIALFFRAMLGDREQTINCAIRLANTANKKCDYATLGRSDGMHVNRGENSQPIPSDQGVADILRKNGQAGVCFIRDIQEAKRRNWWFPTATDDLPDVRTMMIAPINGYIGGTKHMLGMLYVTSSADVFRLKHAEPLKACADLLGAVYPIITGQMKHGSAGMEAQQ